MIGVAPSRASILFYTTQGSALG